MGARVDLANTLQIVPSIQAAAGVGSTPASGVIVGMNGNLALSNEFTAVMASFGPSTSGQFQVQIQTSSGTTSGSFTDPTSGLQRMPTNLLSGGILVVNSGNGQASGGMLIGNFLRPADHDNVRAIVMSGDQFNGPVNVQFGGWLKRTGSGFGTSQSPTAGTPGGF